MAKNAAKATGFVVVALLCGTRGTAAQSADVAQLVVHVTDYQHVPAAELAETEAEVSAVYARAGVQIEWARGCAATAPVDGRLHVDVIVLDRDMADRKYWERRVLGDGSHATKRAYVFYSRIETQARKTGTNETVAFAYVMAHELGHVVLPRYSHTATGLMRADWPGWLTRVPDFLPVQAEAIRLAAAVHRE